MKSGWSSASPIKPGRQAVFTISNIEDELLDSRAMVNYMRHHGARDIDISTPADFYPAIAVSILVASTIKQPPCRPTPHCRPLCFEAARLQSSVVDRDIKLRVELDTIDDNEAGHRLDDWIVVKCPLQKRFVSFHILELRDHDEVGASCH